MLSFPEKEIDVEELNKSTPEEITLKKLDFHRGKKVYTTNWLNLGYKSDAGKVRELDEDSLVVITTEVLFKSRKFKSALFVLGDGVGGHKKGEVASYLGTKTVAEELAPLMLSISEKGEDGVGNAIKASIKKLMKQCWIMLNIILNVKAWRPQ